MDILKLYRDFNVEHYTEGHKHSRPGWVNTECPFCTGHHGYHLGWNANEEYYYCWRCGWKPPTKTISALIDVNFNEAEKIIEQYGINRTLLKHTKKDKGDFTLPSSVSDLLLSHRIYLEGRGFDVAMLIEKYKIQSTSPLSKLEKGSYKHRVLIPYFWNRQMVSFDTRDATDKQKDKYKACPKHLEIIERKHILYGNQEAWTDIGICVEGPTDVWRLGDPSFCTSGIQFTWKQVRLMAQIFKFIWIVFDPEPVAQRQAKKLKAELAIRGCEAQITTTGSVDPGKMSQEEADEFVKLLIN